MEQDPLLHLEAGISIPAGIYEEMLEHAASDSQNEVCGILAGNSMGHAGGGGKKNLAERIFRGENTDRSPVSFELDPRQQIEIEKELKKEGMQMLAIYHSHPEGQAYPSAKDVLLAVWDVIYIIIGLPERGKQNPQVRAFEICGDKTKTVKEVLLRVF